MSRWFWVALLILLLTASGCESSDDDPVKVGILQMQKRPLASSEQDATSATLVALRELQEKGGVIGRPIEVVLSREIRTIESLAKEAERLISEEKVDVLFGCWNSTARKAVLPVLEHHRHLLFYSLQYEGLEESPYVVYTGPVPNQQLVPGIKWALDHLGSRVFWVGSDYVYSRVSCDIARDQIAALGAEIIEEMYVPLDDDDVTEVIDAIVATQPDFILNTLNGRTNLSFFEKLDRFAPDIPTMSMTLTQNDFLALKKHMPVGHFVTSNYFENLETAENQDFLRDFQLHDSEDAIITGPMVSAYTGVHLWAKAAQTANSVEPNEIRKVIGEQSLVTPEGIVSVDPASQHTWKSVRVARLLSNGSFKIEWSSTGPVRPRPFPTYQSRENWEAKLKELYQQWGGKWMRESQR